MKRLIAVLIIAVLSVTCFAAEATYATPNDLFQEWAANGYPDYVSGVWSNDGSMNNLTFALVDGEEGERGREEILTRLGEGSTVQFVYQKYSRNYLANVQDELLPYFEKKIGLISSGLDEMENRISLGILEGMEENPETLAMLDELQEKYGDVFIVEYGRQYPTLEIGYVDNLMVSPEDVGMPTLTYTEKDKTQYFIFALTGIILVATVFALYFYKKRALVKPTNAGNVTESQASMKEVEDAVKQAVIDVPAALDDKVMRDIID